MSIAAKQVKKISNRIVEQFVKSGSMPSFSEASRAIRKILSAIQTGDPLFHPRKQPAREIFTVKLFNDNLDEVVDDLEIIGEEQIDQVVNILRHFNSSEVELRKLNRQIRKLSSDIANLNLLQSDTRGYLYSLGDSFADTSKADLERSTVEFDTEEGMIKLPTGGRSVRKLPFLHLRDKKSGNFKVLEGHNYITKQAQIANSRFGNMFDDINRVWKQHIFTTDPVRVKAAFSFTLTDTMTDAHINQITLISHSRKPTYISVYYKNKAVSDWTPIPTTSAGAYVHGKRTWILNLDSIKQRPIDKSNLKIKDGVTELRIIMSKDEPDTQINNEYLYEFGIRNISVFYISNMQEAAYVSKSLGVKNLINEQITINQLSLQVDEELPHGTATEYYIYPDKQLDLRFLNPNGHVSKYLHPEATTWASGVPADQTSIFESEARAWALANDTDLNFNNTNYKYWEPKWIKVQPLRSAQQTDASGNLGIDVIRFDNIITQHSDDANLQAQWISKSKTTIQNIDFYDIFRFPTKPIPHTVQLWIGKSSWVHRIENDYIVKNVRATGVVQNFISEEGEPEGQFPEEPLITAVGDIIDGSVTDVGPLETLEHSDGFYNGDPPHPDYFTRVIDDKLWIVRNEALATSEIAPNKQIRFNYKVREPLTTNIWETNVFLGLDEEGTIALQTGNVNRILVTNFDPDTDLEIASIDVPLKTKLLNLNTIGRGTGWFNIRMEMPQNSKFVPTNDNIISEGVQYFAIRQPLRCVSEYDLHYNTHKYDHTKCALVEKLDEYNQVMNILRINDITEPTGILEFSTKIKATIGVVTADILFSDRDYINNFFDIKYQAITKEVTNLLCKCVLRSDNPDTTPIIRKYTVKIGNEIRSE